MNELHKTIKKYFEEIGYEITGEENDESAYTLGTSFMIDDIITTTAIHHPKGASFISIKFRLKYDFKNDDHKKVYELVNLINAKLLNIGTMAIDVIEQNEISFFTIFYLPKGPLEKFQFKKTLELLTLQALPVYDLVKKVDEDDMEPKRALENIISGKKAEVPFGQYEIVQQQKINHIPNDYNFSKISNHENEIILTGLQMCFQNEGLPITGEMERQSVGKRPYDLSFNSWCVVSSKAFSIICFYIPEYRIVVIELGGFPEINLIPNIGFLFHTTNRIQVKTGGFITRRQKRYFSEVFIFCHLLAWIMNSFNR